MEKKQNLRTNQVTAKVLQSSDSRKSSQDVSGKQQPRNLRRREFSSNNNSYSQSQKIERPAHNGNYQNNGNTRHQQQQQQNHHQIFAPKSRSNDKRIRNRCNDGYPGSSIPTSSSTGLDHFDDDHIEYTNNEFVEAELNSIYLPGSKKQNLNHLLNFNYAPRERTDSSMYMRSGNISKGHHTYVKRIKYNKEQFLQANKKQNLNHLLNFNYAPRERTDSSMYMRSGNISKGHHTYVKRIKYNKEQFLQANCQFVVKANGDYAPYAISPDLLVEWSNIEQIHMFGSSEEPQCPICLYHPVAAKMTRCGHVYCWPCILHYLALSDKKSWRKCPICYEAVHISDLKSAVAKPYRNYNCDEYVTLQLMCRNKDSLKVIKAGSATPTAETSFFPLLSDHIDKTMHSKLLLAEPSEILSIIKRERSELKCQLTSDGIDCPDSIFVQQALTLLEEREKPIYASIKEGNSCVAAKCNAKPALTVSAPIADLNAALEGMNLNINAKEFVPTDSASAAVAELTDDNQAPPYGQPTDFFIDADTNLTIDDMNIVPMSNDGSTLNPSQFYFYQSSDGQHLYLHSVNVRMLQAMYGSLENAPKSLTGRILQKEVCSMSEELRKRLKYLQHLPVSCHFEIVEIALEAPFVISGEVNARFKDELMQRQKNRQRRAREERKREKHIDRENDRQIGKIIRAAVNIDVTSEQQFPMCGSFDDPALALHSPTISSIVEPPSTSGGKQSKTSTTHAGPSFAKMLTSPRNATNAELWPTLSGPKANPLFANDDFLPLQSPSHRQRTISMASNGTTVSHIEHSDDDSIDNICEYTEATCAPPEFKDSFSSAIAEALNNSAQQIKNNSRVVARQQLTASVPTNGGRNGKKKKNNAKMVLFSTGSRTFDGN